MATDPQIVRALGDLEGTVRSMSKQWAAQEEGATAGRRALYEKFEGMSSQMGKVSSKLDGVVQDVAEMKNDINTNVMPTIDEYKAEVARKIGALAVGKLFWTLMVALASAIGFAIHEVLLYFGSKH